MAINYGHIDELNNLHNEVEEIKKRKILQYTLKYPTLKLNTATYAERKTRGYKYISAKGLNLNSTITFLTHSFSTSTGVNIPGGIVLYSFEFVEKNGDFSYFNIDEINIATLKIPKPGRKYNMFLLNKTYNFSKIVKNADLSKFTLFSVFVTQKSGLLSNDSSELDLFITFKKNLY